MRPLELRNQFVRYAITAVISLSGLLFMNQQIHAMTEMSGEVSDRLPESTGNESGIMAVEQTAMIQSYNNMEAIEEFLNTVEANIEEDGQTNPPRVTEQSFYIAVDETQEGILGIGDLNPDDQLTYASMQIPNKYRSHEGGRLSIDAGTGIFEYTPPAGFEGLDSFDYGVINDRGDWIEGEVQINVNPMVEEVQEVVVGELQDEEENGQLAQVNNVGVMDGANHPPTILDQGEFEVKEFSEFNMGMIAADDQDGDHIIFSGPMTSAQGGQVSINQDGSFDYTPPDGVTSDTITFIVTDEHGEPATGTLQVTINLNNPPTILDQGVFEVEQSSQFNMGMLGADDQDGDHIVFSGPMISAQGGQVSINQDGSFDYTPPLGFTGTDSFTFTVYDEHGEPSAGTLQITVLETFMPLMDITME
jgi:hypothetical protein